MSEARVGRRWRDPLIALVVLVVLLATIGLTAPPAGAFLPDPPGRPAGGPGSLGPCGKTESVAINEYDFLKQVWVFQPTGTAAAPTGGTCGDAERPGVFLAHGYFGILPGLYQDLIDHLVSNGHVVVFANYEIIPLFEHQYNVVDHGFAQGAEMSGRIDLDNVGFAGHSFGGGMTPWLVQQADARGWGSESLWAVLMAPYFSYLTGSGPIDLPDHARVQVIGFDWDFVVDNRVGIELFESFDIPDAQKDHITLRGELYAFKAVLAPHTVPNTGIDGLNALDFYGLYRNIDVLSSCAREGVGCGTDLTYMGLWSNGHPLKPATVSDNPADLGPFSLQECWFPTNPRPCP